MYQFKDPILRDLLQHVAGCAACPGPYVQRMRTQLQRIDQELQAAREAATKQFEPKKGKAA